MLQRFLASAPPLALLIAAITLLPSDTRLAANDQLPPQDSVPQNQTAPATSAAVPLATPEQQGLATESLEAIAPLVDQAIADSKMPGAVVMVGYQGAVVYQQAFGHRQLLPEPQPMLLDTVFDLASLTKPIATGTAVMKLIERGQIGLDDPVAQHLPEFGVQDKQQVTVRQLLIHVGGLIPDNAMRDYQGDIETTRHNFLSLSLNYPPGERFRYSDVGFQVLGELVAAKTGQSLAQFTANELFRPLGMNETGYLPDEPLRRRAAVTQQRNDQWMRGEVHDPRAYAMGGVAGHAGLFSTAADLAIYAQMMLQGGSWNDTQVLTPETIALMTAAYPVPGDAIRGLSWDKQSGYSSNRGKSMTDAAFGHGGFTGTAIWIDPGLDLFVIFLSNRVHPDGKGAVNQLAGAIGTIAADAVIDARRIANQPPVAAAEQGANTAEPRVRSGIDVLAADGFAALQGRRVGLITNHTGVDQQGVPTRLRLHQADGVQLLALLSPEHGIAGLLDQSNIDDSVDPDTGIPVYSLYGKERRPSEAVLQQLDTLVFDIQDIGCRFYTYVSTMGESMRAAAEHDVRFVVLDRPNPIGGVAFGGPMRDADRQAFVGYHTLPVRHAMTVGEIAQMLNQELELDLDLQVIRCEGWRRADFWDQTGLFWINPSPNMRNLNQALLYPGIGLIEFTNLSVGRGTDTPFEIIGAPWLDARAVIAHWYGCQGVALVPTQFTPDASKFSGETCQGIQILVTDRQALDPIRLGLGLAAALIKVHPEQWQPKQYQTLLMNQQVYDALVAGQPLEQLMQMSQQPLQAFDQRRQAFLLYE